MPNEIELTTHVSVTNNFGVSWEHKVVLTYSDADPFFVKFHFHGSAQAYSISRDLMSSGLVTDVSEGHIQIYPHPVDENVLAFVFTSSADRFYVRAIWMEIEDFLADSYDIVAGTDELDTAMLAVEAFLGTAS